MTSSEQQQEICLAAAVADLWTIGITVPEFDPNCGSDDCQYCTKARGTRPQSHIVAETEAQRPGELLQDIRELFENPEATTVPALIEDGETPMLIATRDVEEDLVEVYGDDNTGELAGTDDILCVTASNEQPELLREIDRRRGTSEDEGHEMVNFFEAQIGL